MPGKIFVEYYKISEENEHAPGGYHMLLVYEDKRGQEFVIRGGQKDESISGTFPTLIADQFTPSFGSILVDAGVPAEASRDYGNRIAYNTKETRRELTEEELGYRDPSDLWQLMTARAQEIGEQKIDYHMISGPNSNSTIASVLNTVGINIGQVLPEGTETDNFPGYNIIIPPPQELKNPTASPASNTSSGFFDHLWPW